MIDNGTARPLDHDRNDDALDDLGNMTPSELEAHGRRGLSKFKAEISATDDPNANQEGDPQP